MCCNAGVVAIVTELDGLNFLLFHVEQQKPFAYRWRIARAGEPWFEGSAPNGRPQTIFTAEPGCPVEAEWRTLNEKSKPVGRWRKAALHRFLAGVADFSVTFPHPVSFRKGEPLTFIAPSVFVEGSSSFTHILPEDRLFPAWQAVTVRASATSAIPANHLREAGDFLTGTAAAVTNLTPTTGSLIMAEGKPVLTAQPRPAVSYAAITRKPKPQSSPEN